MLAEVHSAKSLQSRILLPPDAFYYLHPVQAGLLEEPMKLEVITSAETHAQLNKLVNCNALFFVFPVMFRVVALDFNFKPVQEMVGDLKYPSVFKWGNIRENMYYECLSYQRHY